ncbi:MAG: thioredoxin domain-containing protein [Rhodothermales bacterium]|nr:thioredoxin domain-containing protein [Rhodothermales bacterium]
MPTRTLIFLVTVLPAVVIASLQPGQPVPGTVQECEYTDEIPPIDDTERLISFSDPYFGSHDADVTVVELFDPNCRHCKSIHPIMQRVIADNSDRARFYLIPFVLWERSLVQVEALYVAAQEDKYHIMLDRQFHHQKSEGLTPDELADIAAGIGMDRDQFLRRLGQGLNRRSILERRTRLRELGFDGTPAILINGRVVASSSRSARCLNTLIAEAAEAAGTGQAPRGDDGRR